MSFIMRGSGFKTEIARTRHQVDEAIHELVLNSTKKNLTRLIGVDTISIQTAPRKTSIAVLQLCDEGHCFIIQLKSLGTVMPESLYNFLSLPGFTFVGFGIKEAMSMLWKEYGFVCKNTLEARPSVWRNTLSCSVNDVVRTMYVPPAYECMSDLWEGHGHKLIELAVSNAKAALIIGHKLLYPNGIAL